MNIARKLFIVHRLRCPAVIVQRSAGDFSAETLLSQHNLTRAATKFATLPYFRMQSHMTLRKAAVLIPLCEDEGKVSLLYTLRTAFMRSHKGQVSFPGGMQENDDKSLKGTALRETKEELGIDPRMITVWGQGQPIVARGETSVVPVIGTVSNVVHLDALNLNPREVELVFTVAIEEFCKPGVVHHTQFRSGHITPCYLAGNIRIWGLTAVITNAFLKCLLPGDDYKPIIKYIRPVPIRVCTLKF